MSPALYLIDTSGLFRILQDKLRQAWAGELALGVIAICPVVDSSSFTRPVPWPTG